MDSESRVLIITPRDQVSTYIHAGLCARGELQCSGARTVQNVSGHRKNSNPFLRAKLVSVICERSENVASEDRAHDLRITRPTRYQLRYCHCAIFRLSCHARTACNFEVQDRLVVFEVTWPSASKIIPGTHLISCCALLREKVSPPATTRRTN